MRYRLRTLLIVLALGPPLLALGWFAFEKFHRANEQTVWEEGDLSLIHGSGQTIEPDEDDATPATLNDP